MEFLLFKTLQKSVRQVYDVSRRLTVIEKKIETFDPNRV